MKKRIISIIVTIALIVTFIPELGSAATETYTGNNTINAVRNKAAVPFNKTIYGRIKKSEKSDYFKVYLPKAGRLTVNVHSNISDNVIYNIYDANENRLSDGVRYNFVYKGDWKDTKDLLAGTYYIEFEKSMSYTGDYSFVLSYTKAGTTYERNDSSINEVRSTAGIPISKTIVGQLAFNDEFERYTQYDDDYYKLIVPKTGKYSINVNTQIEKINFTVYDNDGYGIRAIDNCYHVNFHDRGSNVYKYDLKKGVYYLGFDRRGTNNTGKYFFKVMPTGTSIYKVKGSRKSVTVKWRKQSGKCYEIQCSKDRKFKKGVKKYTVRNSMITKKGIRKLKRKSTYYVRVRTFVKSGNRNCYSTWSKVRRVRTK